MSIIVVDQSDPGAEFQPNRELQAQGVTVIHGDFRNVSRARNNGVAASSGEIVLFVDDDIDIKPGFLRAHLQEYGDPTVSAVTGPILQPGEELVGQESLPPEYYASLMAGRSVGWNVNFAYKPSWSGAGNLSCRRRVFEAIGGFDEKLYRFNEDAEFSHRLRLNGYVIRYTPSALVIHVPHPTGGTRNEQSDILTITGLVENGYYFLCKIGVPAWKRVLIVIKMYWTHVLRAKEKRLQRFGIRTLAFARALVRSRAVRPT